MSGTYMEKLKDPRWQKKRLKVLERDEWACRICENKEDTLHVHHTYYDPVVNEPWEYPSTSLVTLCRDCHEKEKEQRKQTEQFLLMVLCVSGFLSKDIKEILFCIYNKEVDRLCQIFKERLNAEN